jgi:hypothetical protein
MLPASFRGVARDEPAEIEARIWERTARSIAHYRGAPPELIEARLEALEHEWDIQRAIEASTAGLALAGVALGASVHRRFLLLPAAVCVFVLQNALQRRCALVPLLRRLGFRSRREIDEERQGLLAML